MELFVANALGGWSSLCSVNGQFNIPANSNVVKHYRVENTEKNGQPSALKGKAREDEGYGGNYNAAYDREYGCCKPFITGVIFGIKSCKEGLQRVEKNYERNNKYYVHIYS